MPFKICILIESLNKGGAERSAGLLSEILSKSGHEVYIITIFNDVVYPYKGTLINIGLFKNTSGSIINKSNRYLQIRKQLRKYPFDLILDFRIKSALLRELVLNLFVFNKYRIINMVRSYNLEWYFITPKFLSKAIYRKYLSINTVSLQIKEKIQNEYNFRNVTTIHSPIDIDDIQLKSAEKLTDNNNYIIAVGRLEPVKQFDKLIEAYSKTILPSKNIKLYILGSGSQKGKLERKINKLSVNNHVVLVPFTKNPFKYIKNAVFLVLTSINEGFPRVLIESLTCETPVVSFDCKSGPSEIIIQNKNGILVNNQDFNKLIAAMNKMVLDREFYKNCKQNSFESIEHFSMKFIQKKWEHYLENLGFNK